MNNALGEVGRVQVCRLFGDDQLPHYWIRRNDPSQSKARNNDLGKGSQQDRIVSRQFVERRPFPSGEPEIPVRIIFDDQRRSRPYHVGDGFPVLLLVGNTGWILEIGHRVQDLRVP